MCHVCVLSLAVGMDPLHPLLSVILVSEGVPHTLEVVACRPLDLHTTSIPAAREGKSCLNFNIMLKLCKSQFSELSLHILRFLNRFKIPLMHTPDIFL